MAKPFRGITLKMWLESHGNTNVTDVTVTIKKTVYHGARYFSPNHEREFVCLLGDFPKCCVRSSRTCFRLNDDTRDWYVSYYIQDIAPKFAQYHPFGKMFALSPWNVPDGSAIDRYEHTPIYE